MPRVANRNLTKEMKRLRDLNWPIVAIAHELGCSQQLVCYHFDDKKIEIKPRRRSGQDLAPEQIDDIYTGQKYDNYVGKEWG